MTTQLTRTHGPLAHAQVGALATVGADAATPSTMDTVKDTTLGKNQPMIVGAASAAGAAIGYFSGFGWLGAGLGTLLGNIAGRLGAKQYCKTHPGTDCDPNAGA